MPILGSNTGLAKSLMQGVKRSLLVGFLGAFAVAIFTIFLPNFYQSKAILLPVDAKGAGGLGQLAAAAAAIGIGGGASDSGDANFVDILNSRSIREDILNTEFQFNVRSWRFGPKVPHKETLFTYLKGGNMDRAVAGLGPILVATRDIKSKIIVVSAETKSPELSQQIVQKALKDLEAFLIAKGRTKGGQKALFAEARLAESRGEMAQAEEVFRQFLEGNRNYQTSSDPSVRLRGNRLEAELKLKQQLVMTLAMNREQALLEEKNDVPIVNVLDGANLPIDKSRPKRTNIVILAFVLISAGAWAWQNREWIYARLLDRDDPEELPCLPNKELA